MKSTTDSPETFLGLHQISMEMLASNFSCTHVGLVTDVSHKTNFLAALNPIVDGK